MKERESRSLTQEDLVNDLYSQGRVNVSVRDVANWRKLGLLPEFDVIGQGRGRGPGRAPSVWTRSEWMIDQAAWIHDLRETYRKNDQLYLPLWMLGYPIQFKYVRKAVAGPLKKLLQSLDKAVRAAKKKIDDKDAISLQDVIEDDTDRLFNRKNKDVELFQIPQPLLEAFFQLIFNSDYNLNDVPFEDAVDALKEWEISRRKGDTDLPAGGAIIFEYAPFFQEYFSLAKLKEAVGAAKEKDFIAVQRDLRRVREIMKFFNRMLSLLLTDAPPRMKERMEEGFEDMLPAFFAFGRLFILADLSLRHSGYGERVDYALSEVLTWIRREFNADMEITLKAASAEFVGGMKNIFERLMPNQELGFLEN
jgi:hypothetical protein